MRSAPPPLSAIVRCSSSTNRGCKQWRTYRRCFSRPSAGSARSSTRAASPPADSPRRPRTEKCVLPPRGRATNEVIVGFEVLVIVLLQFHHLASWAELSGRENRRRFFLESWTNRTNVMYHSRPWRMAMGTVCEEVGTAAFDLVTWPLRVPEARPHAPCMAPNSMRLGGVERCVRRGAMRAQNGVLQRFQALRTSTHCALHAPLSNIWREISHKSPKISHDLDVARSAQSEKRPPASSARLWTSRLHPQVPLPFPIPALL